ncbi:4577_t:CDS:2 [Gigaspora margarita]|uniref:4577_t:CDS:1 n=1 Tax=Gigaspora margarita TaxID=4874 RepID=A0ABN7UD02_GIGMA|nr:4577_t:CDS:2 [Gigaspora margarita]
MFKNKHQKIHHSIESAQEQMLENSPHNAKGVQEQTPEIHHNAQEQTLENLPHNTKGVQEQIPENSSYAQEQMPDNLPHNTREFTTQHRVFKNKYQRIHYSAKMLKNKCQRIYHTTPKVFKNKHQRIHHSSQGQMLENSLHNAKGVQEHQRIHHSAKSAKEQMLENSPFNAKGVQELTSMKSPHSTKKIHIMPKMPKNKHQRSAQRQTSKNSHNAEVFKNKPENLSHSAKSAQGQIDGEFTTQSQRYSRTNTREFTTTPKNLPYNSENAQEQMLENSLYNAEITKDKH